MLRTHYGAEEGRETLLDQETTAFLESGCALIVGTVRPDGEPHAGRGWGLDIVGPGDVPQVRLLLDADDETTLELAAAGGAIALTAASVRTLRSVQLKGRSLGLLAPSGDEAARARRYMDQFFTDIRETDGTPAELLEAFEPAAFVACAIEVRERFDQTPGPGAGARIGTSQT
jgi:hypothetical protein